MSLALQAPASRNAPSGVLAFVARAWRSLQPRHFGYAALAGFGIGAMLGLGEVMAAPGSKWYDFFTTAAFQVLLAQLLLLALTVASRVQVRRVPKWLPFVLAGAAIAAVGATVELLLHLAFTPEIAPPRQLAVGVASNFVITLMLLTLASLGYMRGLDAWQRATTLRTLQLERTRMSRKAFESRLQALQARVDPRFLFDTLASIEATYEADARRGERMIDDLIAYLRAALPTLEEAASTLRAEVALVRSWLDLATLRHGERMTFTIAVSDADLEARMPPMVLQPLVQHAVEAIVAGAFSRPRVAISVVRAEDRLRIGMTASGPAFSDTAETSALRAIRERVAVLYAADASLDFRWLNRDETRADLEIPYEVADRDHR